IKAAIVAAYAMDDARPVDSSTYRAQSDSFWGIGDAEINRATALGDDIVLIEMSYGGWVTVMSLNWELAPVGMHPLALRLSTQWPVISVCATDNTTYELCRYDQGKPIQYAALG